MASLRPCFDGRHAFWPELAVVSHSAGGPKAASFVVAANDDVLGQPAATDWLQYIASYPDLILAFGADPAAGQQHYQLYGRTEGRSLDLFNKGSTWPTMPTCAPRSAQISKPPPSTISPTAITKAAPIGPPGR